MAEQSWITGVAAKSSETNAGKSTSSLIDTRNSERTSMTTDDATKGKWAAVDMDVVGINASKISTITSAIDSYVKAIDSHLDGIDADAEQSGAFAGEDVQKAVRDYIGQVKTYCKNLTSQLKAFNDKLREINRVWEANRATLAGNIGQSATFDAGEQYKSVDIGLGPDGRPYLNGRAS